MAARSGRWCRPAWRRRGRRKTQRLPKKNSGFFIVHEKFVRNYDKLTGILSAPKKEIAFSLSVSAEIIGHKCTKKEEETFPFFLFFSFTFWRFPLQPVQLCVFAFREEVLQIFFNFWLFPPIFWPKNMHCFKNVFTPSKKNCHFWLFLALQAWQLWNVV